MTPVSFQFHGPDGKPLANTQFEIRLPKAGFVYAAEGITAPDILNPVTNAQGAVIVSLAPSSSPYFVKFYKALDDTTLDEGDVAFSYKFYVPNQAAVVRVQDLIIDAPPSTKSYDEAAIMAISEAKAAAVSSAQAARASEVGAAQSLAGMANNAQVAAAAQAAAERAAAQALVSQQTASSKTAEVAANAQSVATNTQSVNLNLQLTAQYSVSAQQSSNAAKTSYNDTYALWQQTTTLFNQTKAQTTNAVASATAAESARVAAAASSTSATASATAANTSATNAKASEVSALSSKTSANASEASATASKTAASASAASALSSESNSLDYRNQAEASKSTAVEAGNAAIASRLAAAASATLATNAATAAGNQTLFAFKNRLINGDMRVNQRGVALNLTAGSGYAVDRWLSHNNGAGGTLNVITFSMGSTEQAIAVPSLKATVSAVMTDSSTAKYWAPFRQLIEGFNMVDLLGKPITVSFQFLTSVAGVYTVALVDGPVSTNSCVKTFTAQANVLQRVTLTFPALPADLKSQFSSQVGMGLWIAAINTGTYSCPADKVGAWQNAVYISTVPVVNWALTLNATLQITEVQLELGITPTSFERRPYGVELQLCQRYYCKGTTRWDGYGTANAWYSIQVSYPVGMRAAPSIGLVSSGAAQFATAVSAVGINNQGFSDYRQCVTTAGAYYASNYTADAEF